MVFAKHSLEIDNRNIFQNIYNLKIFFLPNIIQNDSHNTKIDKKSIIV